MIITDSYIASFHNNYLRGGDDTDINISSSLGPWEIWSIEQEDDVIYIRSSHGTYIRADPDKTVNLTTNQGEWERWILEVENNHIYIKSAHGTYLRASLNKTVNLTTTRKEWERWTIKKVPSVMVKIMTLVRNKSRYERVQNNDIMKYDNVNIFPAVDCKNKELISKLATKYRPTIQANWSTLYQFGIICSTISIIEKFLNSKDLYCFILEDDFKVVGDFPYNLTKVEKLIHEIGQTYESVDILHLHRRLHVDNQHRCTRGCGAEGYILTRHGALKLLNIYTGYAPPDSNGNPVTVTQNPLHKFKHEHFITGFNNKYSGTNIDLTMLAHFKESEYKVNDKFWRYTSIRPVSYTHLTLPTKA